MSWQDTARQLLGAQAPDVIGRLQSINPNYDWSGVIQEYVPALNAAYGSDWQDPGRGSSAGIVSALLQNAQADGQRWAASALPAAQSAQHAQEAQIQRSQYHPSGGLGSLLGIAGLGLGLYSGIPMIGSALSGLAGSAAEVAPAAAAVGAAPSGINWGSPDLSGTNMGFTGGSTTIPGLGISMPTNAATGIGPGGNSLIQDSPWGVNPQAGGGMDMTGFLGNQDPFGYDPNFYDSMFGPGVDPNAPTTFQGGMNLSGSPFLGTLDASGNPVQYDILGNPITLNGSSMADPSFAGVLQSPSLLQRIGRFLTGSGGNGGFGSQGSGNSGSTGQGGIWDWLDQQGGALGVAAKASPFLLALNEANRQSGQGQETIDQLRGMFPQYNTLSTGAQTGYADLNSQIGDQAGRTASGYADLMPKYGDLNARIEDTASGTTSLYDNLLGDITGNQSAFLRAQTDPYDTATHNQRRALQEGLAARGVAGSSFGNMDLANFDTTTGVGRANIVGNAMQSALGLRSGVIGNRDTAARAALGMEGANLGAQGNLVGNANEAALRALGMQGQNLGASNATAVNALTGQRGLFDSILRNQQVNNVNRNALLGAGLSASGSLFRPQNSDPFGLSALIRGA